VRLAHPEFSGHTVWLGYCLNLHPGEDLPAVLEGIESITLPLRKRLAPHAPFGVGLYLPASVASEIAQDAGAFASLASLLHGNQLVPFTANSFPFGNFHMDGLKADVYTPAWDQESRLEFTLAVAEVTRRLAQGAVEVPGRVSVSTHPGGYGEWVEGPLTLHAYSRLLARAVLGLWDLQAQDSGPRLSLGLEAEPRASAGDSSALAEFLMVARVRAAAVLREERGLDEAAAERVAGDLLSTCLDTCHAAVEFELPSVAWRNANLGGGASKVQLSSALVLRDPAQHEQARGVFLGLDEPRYLHQVTGRKSGGFERASDLGELGEDLDPWLACDEWRCHFHVPVNLVSMQGLGTTRAELEGVLDAALDHPEAWPSGELHLELETYTWGLLPEAARGTGALIDGIEREYRHALERLARRGWMPVA
jgi:hypothetical protein